MARFWKNAVGSIGIVVDDAICCDTLLFSSYTCGAHVCFLVTKCHKYIGHARGNWQTGHSVFDDVSRCERIWPPSVEMRYRRMEP